MSEPVPDLVFEQMVREEEEIQRRIDVRKAERAKAKEDGTWVHARP